ncbi:MAG: HNH endonuclease [Candidatus Pacearchaeota archaeon]|nr:HNH endonuclease [Candidatus Pacearchaeota archaeon]
MGKTKKYGRICSICHEKITKLSDLELDHTRAHSKGGTKLALAHKDCNRRKSSGSLRQMQKRLGIKSKTKKRKAIRKKPSNKGNSWINPITGRKEIFNPMRI